MIYDDVVSGAKVARPGLSKAMDYVRDDDTLVVWKLDRLGRSMQHLIETVMDLKAKGVGFRSLTTSVAPLLFLVCLVQMLLPKGPEPLLVAGNGLKFCRCPLNGLYRLRYSLTNSFLE